MDRTPNQTSRRDFLRAAGASSLAPFFVSSGSNGASSEPNKSQAKQEPEFPQVPRRRLGKTGAKVSCLALGTIFDVLENQTVLRNAVKWGVTYWDTAPDYAGPNSELGIGKFMADNPKLRKKLFISTKASDAVTIEDTEQALQASLKRLHTDYIDLYHVMDRVKGYGYAGHGLSDPSYLTDELKQWVKSAKKRKLIRFFGFPTHQNMAQCLKAAAKLDWIDVVMPLYNFRLMQDSDMKAAIGACHKAGIGVVAMKTQARRIVTDQDKKLTDHFLKRGFTEGQAKIKAVLQDERITSACVRMENIGLVTQNVAATLDKTKLSAADMEVLTEFARATCSGYCAGCAHICGAALSDTSYISDIMRFLMYHNSYGDTQRARNLFRRIPAAVRSRLLDIDYSEAEARCPQRLPIAKFVAEAVSKLA